MLPDAGHNDLIDSCADESELAKFVDGARRRMGGVAAMKEATGLDIDAIETAWRAHVRAVNFGGDYVDRAEKAPAAEALKILAEGALAFPDYGSLRAAYAERLRAAGKLEEAQREAEAALKDPRIPNPEAAWEVLMWRHGETDVAKAARAAREIIALQPWLEDIHEGAFTFYAQYLRSTGDVAGASRVDADLVRLKTDSAWPSR